MIKIFRNTKHGILAITLCEAGIELYQSKRWRIAKDNNTFYLVRMSKRVPGEKRQMIMFHREILQLENSSLLVDHINSDGVDNRICNLRTVTHQQNMMNRKKHKKSSSQYKGVSWSKKFSMWRTSIKINYKEIGLGKFHSEDEAALAYNEKAKELFGEYANLNVVVPR